MSWDDILNSSEKHGWQTPPALLDKIRDELQCDFDLDAAATSTTAVVERFFGPDAEEPDDRDALATNWNRPGVKVAFLNPPYGHGVRKWMAKAYDESRRGVTVVALVMSRTDVKWWHEYAMRAAQILFVKGRVRFVDPDTGKPRHHATAPSAVVVFRPGSDGPPTFRTMDQ